MSAAPQLVPVNNLSASVMSVTPDLAAKWLTMNVKNRRIKHRLVQKLVRDMLNDRWQITGEAIKFDVHHRLLDGQNRLTAVVVSGVTVPMFVVHGLEPSAQDVMDSGSPRRPSDTLALHDFENYTGLPAAIRAYVQWTTGQFEHAMVNHSIDLSNAEILEIARNNSHLADSAREAARIRRALPVPTGALALSHYLFYRIDSTDADYFFERITEMRTFGKGDPIATLIKRVTLARERRELLYVSTSLFFLIRTWNACRSGEKLTRLQVGSPERGGWMKIPDPR